LQLNDLGGGWEREIKKEKREKSTSIQEEKIEALLDERGMGTSGPD